jgi:hypothetical protein
MANNTVVYSCVLRRKGFSWTIQTPIQVSIQVPIEDSTYHPPKQNDSKLGWELGQNLYDNPRLEFRVNHNLLLTSLGAFENFSLDLHPVPGLGHGRHLDIERLHGLLVGFSFLEATRLPESRSQSRCVELKKGSCWKLGLIMWVLWRKHLVYSVGSLCPQIIYL